MSEDSTVNAELEQVRTWIETSVLELVPYDTYYDFINDYIKQNVVPVDTVFNVHNNRKRVGSFFTELKERNPTDLLIAELNFGLETLYVPKFNGANQQVGYGWLEKDLNDIKCTDINFYINPHCYPQYCNNTEGLLSSNVLPFKRKC